MRNRQGGVHILSRVRGILDRLSQVFDVASDSQLARALGVAPSTLSTWISRDSVPFEKCEEVAEREGVSLDWLVFGREDRAPEIADLDLGRGYQTRGAQLREPNSSPAFSRRDGPDQSLLTNYVFVPRYDVRVSAGGGAHIASEQIVDYLAFRSDWIRQHMRLNPHELALVEVVGDSMEPTFGPEDLLLVDLGRRAVKDDGVYVLRRAGGLLAKRCQTLATGQLQLRSDNAAYSPEIIDPALADDLDIIGRAVWAGRRL